MNLLEKWNALQDANATLQVRFAQAALDLAAYILIENPAVEHHAARVAWAQYVLIPDVNTPGLVRWTNAVAKGVACLQWAYANYAAFQANPAGSTDQVVTDAVGYAVMATVQ